MSMHEGSTPRTHGSSASSIGREEEEDDDEPPLLIDPLFSLSGLFDAFSCCWLWKLAGC